MNVLKDSQTKAYDSLSRYTSFPYYYNAKDDKYIYGITNNLSTNTEYVNHKVEIRDTLDYLSNKYYGRPDYYWIIADFNRIQDPFIKLSDNYTTLKIPAISNIRYKE